MATRATAYRNDFTLMFWCDDCDPYGSGARTGTLTILRTYEEALRHVDWTGNRRRDWKRKIIRKLAEAKGLPKRVGAKQAAAFLD